MSKSNTKHQTPNAKHQTPSIKTHLKHQTSNIKHQTSNIKHQTSNIKHQIQISITKVKCQNNKHKLIAPPHHSKNMADTEAQTCCC
jgi:hypothetical protein